MPVDAGEGAITSMWATRTTKTMAMAPAVGPAAPHLAETGSSAPQRPGDVVGADAIERVDRHEEEVDEGDVLARAGQAGHDSGSSRPRNSLLESRPDAQSAEEAPADDTNAGWRTSSAEEGVEVGEALLQGDAGHGRGHGGDATSTGTDSRTAPKLGQ